MRLLAAGRRALGAAADSLFAVRPLLWIPAVSLHEAGRFEAWRRGGGADAWPAVPLGSEAGIGLLALLLLLAAVHIANGWADRAADRESGKGWPVAAGAVGPRALIGIGGAAFLGAAWLAAAAPPPQRWLLAAAALLGAAYTTPAVSLKRRWALDVAANALGYGAVAFALGAAAVTGAAAAWPRAWLATAPYVLGVAAITVVTMLADREGDTAAGVATTAAVLGPARARWLAIALAGAAAAAGALARDAVPALWGMAAAACVAATPAGATSRAWNRSARVMQVMFLVVLGGAGAWFPLAFAAVLAALSSLYYRARIGEAYPLNEVFAYTPSRRSSNRSAGSRSVPPTG